MPKGKLTCSCGEIIQTDGKNLKKFEITPPETSLKDKLPNPIEVMLAFTILLIPATWILRFIYGGGWIEAENNFFSKLFGISPGTYEVVKVLIGFLIIIFWLIWRRRKMKN